MESFANHVGLEQDFEALGRNWKAARLDRGTWRKFFAWGRTVLPDPQAEAHAGVRRLALEEFRLMKLQRALSTSPENRSAEQKALIDEEAAKGTPVDPEILEHLLKTNRDEQRHAATLGLDKATSHLSFGSPEVNSLMASVEGMSYLLWLLLEPAQKDATPDTAYAIVIDLGPEKVQELFATAAGTSPTAPKVQTR